jgi:hypothetical protein
MLLIFQRGRGRDERGGVGRCAIEEMMLWIRIHSFKEPAPLEDLVSAEAGFGRGHS